MKKKGAAKERSKGCGGRLSFNILRKRARMNNLNQSVESRLRSNKGSSDESEADINDIPRTIPIDTSNNNNNEQADEDAKKVPHPNRSESCGTIAADVDSVSDSQRTHVSSSSRETIKVRTIGEKLGFVWGDNIGVGIEKSDKGRDIKACLLR